MSDYLTRLVQRAQSLAPSDIASAGAPPRAADAAIDDPFETVGEPEPPVWPATAASPPPQRVASPPDRTDVDAAPPSPVAAPTSPPHADAAQPTPAEPPRVSLPLPPDTPMPPEPAAPQDQSARSAEPPPARAPRQAPPPLAVADAFMEPLMPRSTPPAPPIAAVPLPPRREVDEVAEGPSQHAVPRSELATPPERPMRRDPLPPAVTAKGEPPILEPVEPEPRLSIGRLTVTVERPPARQEVTVTRIVQAAPARGSRSGRPRPRFGLAQS